MLLLLLLSFFHFLSDGLCHFQPVHRLFLIFSGLSNWELFYLLGSLASILIMLLQNLCPSSWLFFFFFIFYLQLLSSAILRLACCYLLYPLPICGWNLPWKLVSFSSLLYIPFLLPPAKSSRFFYLLRSFYLLNLVFAFLTFCLPSIVSTSNFSNLLSSTLILPLPVSFYLRHLAPLLGLLRPPSSLRH